MKEIRRVQTSLPPSRESYVRDVVHLGRASISLANEDEPQPQPQSQHQQTSTSELEEAAKQSQHILIQADAIFPFDLFPDTITVDRQKLTIVRRELWKTKQTVSVAHNGITNIQADMGPLFGSLTVTSGDFMNGTQTIRYLRKRDVLAVQQLVQGLILAQKEGIDTNAIEDDQTLLRLLDKLGRGEAAERPVVQ